MRNINLNLSEHSFSKVLAYKEHYKEESIKKTIIAIIDKVVDEDEAVNRMAIQRTRKHLANLEASRST